MNTEKNQDVQDVGAFILAGKNSAPEMYADGLSQFMIGYPLSRVVLHSVAEPGTDASKEVRKANLVLTMPTQSLVEAAQLILSVCSQNKEALYKITDEQAQKLKQALDSGESKA